MEYEKINHPEHYMLDGRECIDIIEDMIGTDATIAFCKGNVIKYWVRAGNKPYCPADEDMKKMRCTKIRQRNLRLTAEEEL